MPVAKRQARTAEQQWYAMKLRRKSPDENLDDIIEAIKAKHDCVASASTRIDSHRLAPGFNLSSNPSSRACNLTRTTYTRSHIRIFSSSRNDSNSSDTPAHLDTGARPVTGTAEFCNHGRSSSQL
jgi:hypothetical protein